MTTEKQHGKVPGWMKSVKSRVKSHFKEKDKPTAGARLRTRSLLALSTFSEVTAATWNVLGSARSHYPNVRQIALCPTGLAAALVASEHVRDLPSAKRSLQYSSTKINDSAPSTTTATSKQEEANVEHYDAYDRPSETLSQDNPTAFMTIATSKEEEVNSVDVPLWKQAHGELLAENPELLKAYWKVLAGKHGKIVADNDDLGNMDVLEQVPAIVEGMVETMEKTKWTFRVWHWEIGLRDQVDKTIKAFRIFQNLGSTAAGCDPFKAAGLVWAGVCFFLNLIENDQAEHAQLVGGLRLISDLITFYAEAETFYLSINTNPKPLVNLYKHILEFQLHAMVHFHERDIKKFWKNAIIYTDWSGKLRNVKEKDEECRKWIEKSVAENLDKQLKNLAMKIDQQQADTDKILKWVSNVPVRDAHIFVRETKLGRAYWNTGQWLIRHSEFSQWKNLPSGIFCLEGAVGVGKTCLVSIVIEEFHQMTDCHLAFFYCSRQYETRDSHRILLSLVAQLSYSVDSKSIPEPIRKRYEERSSQRTGGNLSVKDCEELLVSIIRDRGPTTVVIDALDECPDHDKLLKSLERVYADSPSLKLFFSSRKMHLSAADYFSDHKPVVVKVLNQTTDDVQSFIKRELGSIDRRRNSCIGKYPDLEKRLRDALIERAGTMFRWVELQLEIFLNRRKPILHRNEFEERLKRMISGSPHPDLNKAYREIFLLNTDGPYAKAYATKALKCVLHSFRPLKIQELAQAIALNAEGEIDLHVDESYVLNVCSNFILTDDSGTVHLAHQSVREYLKEETSYSSSQAHAQLAESCLNFIIHNDIRGMGISLDKHDFLQYAVIFWAEHCESIPKERQKGNVKGLLTCLFGRQNSKLIDWVFLADNLPWNVLGPLSSAIGKARLTRTIQPTKRVICIWGFHEFMDNESIGDCSFTDLRENFSALCLASDFGQVEVVRRLIHGGRVDINEESSHESSALQRACQNGHHEVAKLLLESGADANPRNYEYGSALERASYNGYKKIVRLLLQNGADANAYNGSALENASRNGHQEIVKLLVEYGAHINDHILCLECVHGHQETVEFLLEKGAYINAQSGKYGSALQEASCHGHQEIVQLLLDRGADVNIQGGNYGSALHAASLTGHKKIVQLLLDRGANVNAHVAWYGSALQAASAGGKRYREHLTEERKVAYQETVQLLLVHGADVNAQGGKYGSALQAASKYGHQEIVRLLLEHGANVNLQGGKYGTALQAASAGAKRYEEQLTEETKIVYQTIVQLLLDHGAEVNTQGGQYGTALKAASQYGHQRIVELLLEHGANVNAKVGEYGTALQVATLNGHQNIVQLLLDRGADANARVLDFRYGGPLRAASRGGNKKVVELLRGHGAASPASSASPISPTDSNVSWPEPKTKRESPFLAGPTSPTDSNMMNRPQLRSKKRSLIGPDVGMAGLQSRHTG